MTLRELAPLRHAVGPILFLLIASRLDRLAVIEAISVANPALVGAAGLFVLAAVPLRAIRWSGILERMGHSIALKEAMRLSASATFAGTATPARAGELYKAAPLVARGVPAAAALGSVFLDRALDLVLVALVALLYASAVARGAAGALAVTGLMAFGAVACAGFLAGAEPALSERASRSRVESMGGLRASLLRAALALAPPASLARAGSLTLAATGAAWLANHLLVRSLGLPLDPLQTAGVSAVAGLAALLPVSVLGIGTRDAALLFLLAPYGIEPPAAVALATLFLLLNAWTGLACGIASALVRKPS